MSDLIEITSWIHFKRPGIKKEIIELSEECKDVDEFRNKLKERYKVDLSTAYTISKKFYKPNKK